MNRLEACQAIRSLSKEEFEEKISLQKLPDARKNLLFKFLRGDLVISGICHVDVEEYALKTLLPEIYPSLERPKNPYSHTPSYEYDLPKNGQNIVKHGLGFDEVVNYSNQFGTLMVYIPSDADGKRLVIFSNLDLQPSINKLQMPPPGVKKMNYVMSIVKETDGGKFRFISARLLSSKKKKYEQTISQVLGEIIPDAQARLGFIDRCVEVLERDLIRPRSNCLAIKTE